MNKKWLWLLLFLPLTVPLLHAATAKEDDDDMADAEAVKKTVTWPNGDHYEGEYVGKERTGKGLYLWANGDRYQGEFVEGKPDGEGEYTWANGDRYKGEYLEGKRDGQGTYIWANGDRFEGEFTEGRRGKGKLTRAKKTKPPAATTTTQAPKKVFELSPEQAKVDQTSPPPSKPEKPPAQTGEQPTPISQGTVPTTDHSKASKVDKPPLVHEESTTAPSSSAKVHQPPSPKIANKVDKAKIAEGTSAAETSTEELKKTSAPVDTNKIKLAEEKPLDTKLTGQVKVSWPNGDHYEGEYSHGKRTGKGIYTWANGDRYEGEFLDGQPQGQGIYTWANKDRYTGKYLKGIRTDDKGVYSWANGDRYEGQFVTGKRTGKGTLIWADGESYEGDFVDGKRTGKGVYRNLNGDRYEGEFIDGKRTGKGIFTLTNGESPELEFQDNKVFMLQELEFKNGIIIDVNGEYQKPKNESNRKKPEEPGP